MLQLTDVKVFVHIQNAGSLTGAAKTLRLPKSSVARQLTRLEAALGAPLFHRTTRTLALTDEGHTFLPHARRLLDDSIEAASALQPYTGGAAGQLTVSAPTTFGQFFLAPHAADFRARHPKVQLVLKLTATKVGVAANEADIAIRLGAVVEAHVRAQRLGQIDFCLVAAPSYLKRRAAPTDPIGLSKHEHIALRPPVHDNRIELSRNGASQSVRCVPMIDVDDPESAKIICAAGAGIAVLPTFLAADDLREGKLVEILSGWKLDHAPINVIHATNVAPSTRTRAYLDFLQETLGARQPWNVAPP